jgi:ring-1,2-phenylacetyl-CoA epoxidase subunit PaaD
MVIKLENQDIDSRLLPLLDAVNDPEIPVLSVVQMGVVRSAQFTAENQAIVKITPTYSGCPAMDTMAVDIRHALENAGIHADVELVLSPAWSTDWITPQARQKLEEYGIAPPLSAEADKAVLLGQAKIVACPQCKSKNTRLISQFGSTACKALFRCDDCLEPFDYFKCLK